MVQPGVCEVCEVSKVLVEGDAPELQDSGVIAESAVVGVSQVYHAGSRVQENK